MLLSSGAIFLRTVVVVEALVLKKDCRRKSFRIKKKVERKKKESVGHPRSMWSADSG